MTEMSGTAAGGLPPVPVLQPDAALTLAAVAPPERGLVDPPPAVVGTDSRHEQLYPILTEAQLAELRPLGDERSFRAGEVLWRIGERDICVFVVLSGRRRGGAPRSVGRRGGDRHPPPRRLLGRGEHARRPAGAGRGPGGREHHGAWRSPPGPCASS